MCVCVWWWSVGTGYNCIALPSHSVYTPICLFNIQLSTLDLEASMTAQSHIHTNTSMADSPKRRRKRKRGANKKKTGEKEKERRKKKKKKKKTRCEKCCFWDKGEQENMMDRSSPYHKEENGVNRTKLCFQGHEWIHSIWFCKGRPRGLFKKMLFQQKTCKISWESRNQEICYLPPGVPFMLLWRVVHSWSCAFRLS